MYSVQLYISPSISLFLIKKGTVFLKIYAWKKFFTLKSIKEQKITKLKLQIVFARSHMLKKQKYLEN